ncbi:MAG: hypothetical protein KDD69_19885, partial [Bdellovibrionales bacterium]|nr:hypothetical protein [Bdellovibrionales bacterium]
MTFQCLRMLGCKLKRWGACGLLLAVAISGPVSADTSEMKSMAQLPDPGAFQTQIRAIPELMLAAEKLNRGKALTAPAKGKYSEAAAEARRLLGTLSRGYHDELYFLLGVAQQQLGQSADALASYERSLALRSNNQAARFRRAELLQQANRLAEADAEFRELLWAGEDEKHLVLYRLAQVLIAQGKGEEALKLSEQARQQSPGFVPVLRLLVDIRKRQLELAENPTEKAHLEAQIAADLAVISAQDPTDRDAGLALARFLLQDSDPLLNAQRLAEAEAIAQRLADASGFADGESVRVLFDAQVKRGKLSEA